MLLQNSAINFWYNYISITIITNNTYMLYVYSSSLWLSDMTSVILADELPHDVTGAEELIQRLQEHKTEIDARKTSIDLFLRKGKKLVASNHYAKDEVKTLKLILLTL